MVNYRSIECRFRRDATDSTIFTPNLNPGSCIPIDRARLGALYMGTWTWLCSRQRPICHGPGNTLGTPWAAPQLKARHPPSSSLCRGRRIFPIHTPLPLLRLPHGQENNGELLDCVDIEADAGGWGLGEVRSQECFGSLSFTLLDYWRGLLFNGLQIQLTIFSCLRGSLAFNFQIHFSLGHLFI